jgi:hypothetical protein
VLNFQKRGMEKGGFAVFSTEKFIMGPKFEKINL